jgi:hypothetical protein
MQTLILFATLFSVAYGADLPRGCDFSMPGAPSQSRPWLEIHDSAGFAGTRYRFAAYQDGTWRYVPGSSAPISGRFTNPERRAFQQALREQKVFTLTFTSDDRKDASVVCIRTNFDGQQAAGQIQGNDPFAVWLREQIGKIASRVR